MLVIPQHMQAMPFKGIGASHWGQSGLGLGGFSENYIAAAIGCLIGKYKLQSRYLFV